MNQLTLDLDVKTKPKELIKRHKFDRYDSPAWFLTHLAKYIDLGETVGEPCVGSGNLSSLLPYFRNCNFMWTNDIDPDVISEFHLDAANEESWQHFPETDWVVTNPPFDAAIDILRNAYKYARVGVVMFLRMSFIEPTTERADWLYVHPRYLDLVYPRFKFRKDRENKNWQTDSVPIVAFVWRKDTTHTLGSITVPQSHILGFHDNPENAIKQKQQVANLYKMQDECDRDHLK